MTWTDFRSLPITLNRAIFGAAAVVVWLAGTRLATYAGAIGARPKLSKVFLPMIFLGIATSLPEIATTVTGAQMGSASLVAENLFGGVARQIAVLAIADVVAVGLYFLC